MPNPGRPRALDEIKRREVCALVSTGCSLRSAARRGLMATGTCEEVGAAYGKLDKLVKAWGSQLRAPYMSLSFMALLVIPALKLSDRGLFDGAKFEFTPLVS